MVELVKATLLLLQLLLGTTPRVELTENTTTHECFADLYNTDNEVKLVIADGSGSGFSGIYSSSGGTSSAYAENHFLCFAGCGGTGTGTTSGPQTPTIPKKPRPIFSLQVSCQSR